MLILITFWYQKCTYQSRSSQISLMIFKLNQLWSYSTKSPSTIISSPILSGFTLCLKHIIFCILKFQQQIVPTYYNCQMDLSSMWVSPSSRHKKDTTTSEDIFNTSTSKNKESLFDRFIPKKLNFDTYMLTSKNMEEDQNTNMDKPNLNESLKRKQSIEKYQNTLKKNLSSESTKGKMVNYFDSRRRKEGMVFQKQENEDCQDYVRSIPLKPYKLLQVPKLKDDFYYNILDWSKDDLIATSLNNNVYMWSGRQNEAQKITQGRVSCVKFCHQGLALGDQLGNIRIHDTETRKITHKFSSHFGRVGTIDFNNNIMVTGSKDERIILHDLRCEQVIDKLCGHKQQVCSIRWSHDGNHLASGGNDNKVMIWSSKMNKNICKFQEHTAAVKGLAWSPHKHSILASGGGTSDKTIKLWNTSEMSLISSVDSGSQVCNMVFSQSVNQLLTTHGYSLNTICIWRQKDMKKIATLHGHSYRVLYLAMSPDGESIVTGSGDETMRFWKVFPPKTSNKSQISALDFDSCIVR